MANFYPPGFKHQQNTIAIDFDGVIHDSHNGWGDGTCYGDPLFGSIEAIKELSKKYKIVVFTAKAKPDRPLVNGKNGVELVNEWLDKYGVLDCVQEVTSEKPRAMFYIDDNGYRFENWENTLQFIGEKL